MKTKLLLTTILALPTIYALAQNVNVTAGSYSKCDTCFIFTASPMGPAGGQGSYTYQWTFTGATPASDTGQTITYCSPYASINYADTLSLTLTYIDTLTGLPDSTYYFNTLTNLLPNLGINTTVQPICMVTIDTSINKNLIVWEQTTDTFIVSYKLYKETATSGVYNILATIPRSVFSTYTDTSSQPGVKSARYRLTTMDSCNSSNSESQPGAPHKTMHLTVSSGTPPAWNLVWENYDGLSFLKYRIWRKSISNGWQLIDSVSSSSTTYSDLTPPAGLLYYVIEILSPNVCSPSLKTSQVYSTYSSSLSNVADNGVAGIGENNFSMTVQIFPNPFSAQTVLQTDYLLHNATLTLYNCFGQTVKQFVIRNSDSFVIRRDNLPSGLYFIRLTSARASTDGEENKIIAVDKLVITD